MRAGAGALALAAALSTAAAGDLDRPRRAVEIVPVDTLRIELTDMSVLDTRPMEVYLEGHIPPAFPADADKLAAAVLATAEPDPAAVLAALGRAPLRSHQPTVVYDSSTSGRLDGWVAWLLSYAGVPEVSILDGGFAAWNRRRNLGVFLGHPMPSGRRSLQPAELTPRLDLRIDPAAVESGVPEGSVLVEVGDAKPEGEDIALLHAADFLDDQGHFLYPYHLRELLASRGVSPDARLLLRGEPSAAGLAWAALTGNGFEAALVVSAGPAVEPGSPR